jgi:hypothetical protein
MFRRGMNRPLRRAMMADITPALQRANQLMAAGQYAEAASIFEQFARGALQRNGPRAPQFFLEAGRARVLAGQVPAGVALLKQGMTIIANRGNFQRLTNVGRRFVDELNQRGLKAEATDIEAWLKQTIPGGFAPGPATGSAKPRLLPTNCPGCGGPLHADEVEWSDEATAECPYCGSAVRAESIH